MQKSKLQVKNQNLPKGWRKACSPKNWRRVKLGEVAELDWGDTNVTKASYKSSGYLAYSATGPDGFLDYYDYDQEGIVLSAIGANCGETWFVKGKWSCIKNTIRFWGKKGKADTKFLFYRTHNKRVWPTRGSAQPFISKGDARDIEITIPEDINEQKRIAEILSAFDDKIELNNKISAALEQMAQEIFKEWFVNFRFPGHEKAKSRSERSSTTGIKMVDSELGKIPEGWKLLNAEEILIFERGVEPGSKYYSEEIKENYIPFFRVKDLLSEKAEVHIPKEVSKNKICREKDVLLSLDASIGRVQIGCNGSYSSGLRKIYPKKEFDFINSSFIYLWAKSFYVQSVISTYLNSGSTIAHAGKAVRDFTLPFNKDIIIQFQKIVDPMWNIILKNKKENQKLAALRDLLLPKLMSGEIRV